MPPLLQAIIRSMMDRTFAPKVLAGDAPTLKNLEGVVPFEVSGVRELLTETGWRLAERDDTGQKTFVIKSDLSFLPAPRTWIEQAAQDGGGRYAALFEEDGSAERKTTMFLRTPDGQFFVCSTSAPLNTPLDRGRRDLLLVCRFRSEAALPLINMPKIIGRVQHPPHAGLQRELVRNKKLIGAFPLHAWSEIKLEVRPPKREGDTTHEPHLTGEKALEFVRQHIRFQNGRWVQVRWHFRGNPALGIRQRNYKLVDKTRAA